MLWLYMKVRVQPLEISSLLLLCEGLGLARFARLCSMPFYPLNHLAYQDSISCVPVSDRKSLLQGMRAFELEGEVAFLVAASSEKHCVFSRATEKGSLDVFIISISTYRSPYIHYTEIHIYIFSLIYLCTHMHTCLWDLFEWLSDCGTVVHLQQSPRIHSCAVPEARISALQNMLEP